MIIKDSLFLAIQANEVPGELFAMQTLLLLSFTYHSCTCFENNLLNLSLAKIAK